MTPLRFPTTPILPAEDETERALHTCIDVAHDFGHAIVAATTVGRAVQLRQRIHACIELLEAVEAAAFKKMDDLD